MKKLILFLCMTAMLTGCGVEGKSSEADSGKSTVIEKEETTSADTSEAETSTENSTEAETTAEITTTEAAEEETTAEITTAEAEEITENVNTVTYRSVLEGIYYDRVLPDGEALPDTVGEDISENQFAVYDADKDGRDELIFMFKSTYMAGMFSAIYDHDADGNITNQFQGFPAMRFYSNGVIESDASHNQGPSVSFWPYALYQYDAASDKYDRIAHVEAMEKGVVNEINKNAADYGIDPPYEYPSDIDTSGWGLVYYIYPVDGSSDIPPVDLTEYEAWHNQYIGGAELVDVPFMNLTEENIQKVNQ